jgi:hypothetical protein
VATSCERVCIPGSVEVGEFPSESFSQRGLNSVELHKIESLGC